MFVIALVRLVVMPCLGAVLLFFCRGWLVSSSNKELQFVLLLQASTPSAVNLMVASTVNMHFETLFTEANVGLFVFVFVFVCLLVCLFVGSGRSAARRRGSTVRGFPAVLAVPPFGLLVDKLRCCLSSAPVLKKRKEKK